MKQLGKGIVMTFGTRLNNLKGWWRIWLVIVAAGWLLTLNAIWRFQPSLLAMGGIDAATQRAGEALVRRGKCAYTYREAQLPGDAAQANPYFEAIVAEQSGGAPASAVPVPNGVEVDFKTGENVTLDALASEVLCLKPGTNETTVEAVRDAYHAPDLHQRIRDIKWYATVRILQALGLTILAYVCALVLKWVVRGFANQEPQK